MNYMHDLYVACMEYNIVELFAWTYGRYIHVLIMHTVDSGF